jgi:hypothetical protein
MLISLSARGDIFYLMSGRMARSIQYTCEEILGNGISAWQFIANQEKIQRSKQEK